jgi:hypothetical protein
MYIYSCLFCLYQCKDYCHRVTTQLQLVIMTIITNIYKSPVYVTKFSQYGVNSTELALSASGPRHLTTLASNHNYAL